MAVEVFLLEVEASNWRSVNCSLAEAGFKVSVVSADNIDSLTRGSILVLPGVGNIKYLSERFSAKHDLPALANSLKTKNIGIIGICLGFQFLCQSSSEHDRSQCLSMLDLKVEALFNPPKPSVGWRYVAPNKTNELVEPLANVIGGGCFYFTHCYGVKKLPPASNYLNTYVYATDGSSAAVAAVVSKRIIGLQFHPEKSGKIGSDTLKSAIEFLAMEAI